MKICTYHVFFKICKFGTCLIVLVSFFFSQEQRKWYWEHSVRLWRCYRKHTIPPQRCCRPQMPPQIRRQGENDFQPWCLIVDCCYRDDLKTGRPRIIRYLTLRGKSKETSYLAWFQCDVVAGCHAWCPDTLVVGTLSMDLTLLKKTVYCICTHTLWLLFIGMKNICIPNITYVHMYINTLRTYILFF